jgi:serine/threonine protein kinase
MAVVENDALAMSKLKHPNIVAIEDYIPKSTVERSSGKTYNILCVHVMEYAENGELFYFIKNTGYFTESMARYFFH